MWAEGGCIVLGACTAHLSARVKEHFFHFSSTRSSSAKCGILSKPTVGPCSAANGNGIATRYKAARSLLLKVDVHGLEELVNHGLNELGRVCIQHLQTCFALGSRGPGQAGTVISGLRRCVLLTRSCSADLKDQSVFRTLWRVHRSWPSPIRRSSEHQCERGSAPPFRRLLRPAEARQLRYCDDLF